MTIKYFSTLRVSHVHKDISRGFGIKSFVNISFTESDEEAPLLNVSISSRLVEGDPSQ